MINKGLTVTDVMKIEGYKLNKGYLNLIVSPVSSGKTYYMFEELLRDADLSKVIYLCDTNGLEEAVRFDENYQNKCKFFNHMDIYQLGKELAFHQSGIIKDERVTVMTYSQLGMLLERSPNCLDEVEIIICDEAHNLINYANKFDKDSNKQFTYTRVINMLKEIKDEKLVAMFTATQDRIRRSPKINDTSFYVYDFSNYSNIKKLREKNTIFFNNYKNLERQLGCYNGFRDGYKCLIYTDKISTIKNMINMLQEIGLSVCGLWSTHNEKNPMTDKQHEVRKSIIQKGKIPDEIDVLIINASYETGINITDERIDMVVINSTNKDTQIQARGRVRKHITNLYLLHPFAATEIVIALSEEWLDKPLIKHDKDRLATELNLYDGQGRLIKWNRLQEVIRNNGYLIEENRIRIDKKLTRVSTITKDDEFVN